MARNIKNKPTASITSSEAHIGEACIIPEVLLAPLKDRLFLQIIQTGSWAINLPPKMRGIKLKYQYSYNG